MIPYAASPQKGLQTFERPLELIVGSAGAPRCGGIVAIDASLTSNAGTLLL
jgi:hypothetical protein